MLSAFPAVVGPALLIVAQQHGAPFAARAAGGTLFGLVALAGFVLAYAWVSTSGGWVISLAAGWIAAAVIAASIEPVGAGTAVPIGLIGAAVALAAAYRAMPARRRDHASSAPGGPIGSEVVVRMAVTAGLVAGLTLLAKVVGPLIAGMVAGLPVLASVLAVFTHRREGAGALVDLLRGMVTGMAGFAAFCAVVGLLIVPAGTVIAFAAATVSAVAFQAVSLARPTAV